VSLFEEVLGSIEKEEAKEAALPLFIGILFTKVTTDNDQQEVRRKVNSCTREVGSISGSAPLAVQWGAVQCARVRDGEPPHY
jgi:hypothetical protein